MLLGKLSAEADQAQESLQMNQRKVEASLDNTKEDKGKLFNRHHKQLKELKQKVSPSPPPSRYSVTRAR